MAVDPLIELRDVTAYALAGLRADACMVFQSFDPHDPHHPFADQAPAFPATILKH
ncbi:hypothetical protein AB0M39_06135 [Streptomyces sp. NPDC051907]|uniref:hypothetical protein n=1 Tax=Streptomyces sp. NPDC051907 TaxID=3155284 RepID=UPI00341C0BE6